jgi:hypothetical protein
MLEWREHSRIAHARNLSISLVWLNSCNDVHSEGSGPDTQYMQTLAGDYRSPSGPVPSLHLPTGIIKRLVKESFQAAC